MKTLNENSTPEEIIANLKDCDPVYGPVRGNVIRNPGEDEVDFALRKIQNKNLAFESVRICALCGARSLHQGENVIHQSFCPWTGAKLARAKQFICATRDGMFLVFKTDEATQIHYAARVKMDMATKFTSQSEAFEMMKKTGVLGCRIDEFVE